MTHEDDRHDADAADLRKHKRRVVNVELRVRDAADPETGELVFDAVDLSGGGVFLRSDLLLEVGDELEVSITPLAGPPILAKARVAWTTPRTDTKGQPGMGLEFTDLSKRDQERLALLLRA